MALDRVEVQIRVLTHLMVGPSRPHPCVDQDVLGVAAGQPGQEPLVVVDVVEQAGTEDELVALH